MDDLTTQGAGVLAVFAFLVIKELISLVVVLVRGKRGCGNGEVERVRYDALTSLIKTVNENISAQTGILRDMARELMKIKSKLP